MADTPTRETHSNKKFSIKICISLFYLYLFTIQSVHMWSKDNFLLLLYAIISYCSQKKVGLFNSTEMGQPFGPISHPFHHLNCTRYQNHRAAVVMLHWQQAAEHAHCLLCEVPPLRWHAVGSPPLPVDKLLVEGVCGQCLLPGEVSCQYAEEQHAKGPYVGAVIHTEALVVRHITKLWGRRGDSAIHLKDKESGLKPEGVLLYRIVWWGWMDGPNLKWCAFLWQIHTNCMLIN